MPRPIAKKIDGVINQSAQKIIVNLSEVNI